MFAKDLEEVITPRQLELLALFASGYNYEAIGNMKFISPYTVRNILAQALKRSGARSLANLCAVLVDHGMIRRDGNKFVPVQAEGIVGE